MKIAVRASGRSLVRCAYCHTTLHGASRQCGLCSTWLHDECFVELERRCPTLACGVAARIRIIVQAAQALEPRVSLFQLLGCVFFLGLVWTALFVIVPAFDKMFMETGVALPALTEVVMAVSRHFVPGVIGGVATFAGLVALFIKRRRRERTERILFALAVLGFLCLPVLAVALFLPLTQMIHRL